MPLVAPSWRTFFLELHTRIRLALGDPAAAERASALADEAAAAIDLPLPRAWADRALAVVALAQEDPRRAADLALRSAAVADEAGVPFEGAVSRILAGRALARAGEADAATDELLRAVEVLEGVGAVRHREEAERELRRLGHRVTHRRSPPAAAEGDGVGTLTQRELEIARAIVDRKTNRQIAQDLFLSPKTVETHIRNIFAKLGADSRVEVARIVERADRLAAQAS
jgi:DNA-binding CsgD family transcriptional regulator